MTWQDDYVYGSSDYPATGAGDDVNPETWDDQERTEDAE
jgi:hypothetical protein